MPIKIKDIKPPIVEEQREPTQTTYFINFFREKKGLAFTAEELTKELVKAVDREYTVQDIIAMVKRIQHLCEDLELPCPLKTKLGWNENDGNIEYFFWKDSIELQVEPKIKVEPTKLPKIKKRIKERPTKEIKMKPKVEKEIDKRSRLNRDDIIKFIKRKKHTIKEIQEEFNFTTPTQVYYWLAQAKVKVNDLPKKSLSQPDKTVIEESSEDWEGNDEVFEP